MARQLPARFFGAQTKRNPEAVFAASVMKYLRQLYGGRLWETPLRGGLGMRAGVPDRVMCIDGCFVAIEFKNPDGSGRLGPKQKVELDGIDAAKGMVIVCSDWEHIKPIIERFEPNQRIMKEV